MGLGFLCFSFGGVGEILGVLIGDLKLRIYDCCFSQVKVRVFIIGAFGDIIKSLEFMIFFFGLEIFGILGLAVFWDFSCVFYLGILSLQFCSCKLEVMLNLIKKLKFNLIYIIYIFIILHFFKFLRVYVDTCEFSNNHEYLLSEYSHR